MNGFLKSKPMQKLVNFKKSSWNCKRLIILQKFYINFFFFLVKKFGGWIWWSWNLHLWQWGSSKLLLASIAVSWNSDLRRKWRKFILRDPWGFKVPHLLAPKHEWEASGLLQGAVSRPQILHIFTPWIVSVGHHLSSWARHLHLLVLMGQC